MLEQVRAQAEAAGVDADTAVAFFRDQITASKAVQRALFARWTAHPEEAPTTRPDLGVIRVRLDRLTTDLLAELRNTAELRDKPVTCSVRLAPAEVSGAVRERLDAPPPGAGHGDELRVPHRWNCQSRAAGAAAFVSPGMVRALMMPSTPWRKVSEISFGSKRQPAAIAPSRSITK